MPSKEVYPDLIELIGGTEPIVVRARKRCAESHPLKALRLLDVGKAAGPESRSSLQLRLEILEGMLESSINGFDNMSET